MRKTQPLKLIRGEKTETREFSNNQAENLVTSEQFEKMGATPKNITIIRMGDFYEAYGDEAVELANKLNLALTSKTINGERVQMVGFPVSSLDNYKSALGSGYDISVADTPSVTNKAMQGTPVDAENPRANEGVTGADVINHAKEIDGLKLVDTEESTLVNGKTLITGIYSLNSEKNFDRKSYKKEKFSIIGKADPWVMKVDGATYGHYGFAKSGTSGYIVTYLPAGVSVERVNSEKEAKRLLAVLETKFPELPLSIKSYGNGYRCYGLNPELATEVRNAINSAAESAEEINLPFKNKRELVLYLKKHIGDKIGVSYNGGAEDVRTIVSASNTTIVTECADGQQGRLSAKSDELSYTDSGFVYTGSNGANVSYRFISDNAPGEEITGSAITTETPEDTTGKNVIEAPYDEQKAGRDFIDAVDDDMLKFIDKATSNQTDNKSVYVIGKTTNKLNRAINELTGVDTILFNHSIKANCVRHIIKDHGANGLADQSMSNAEDIARMGYVIQNFDDLDLLDTTSKEYRDKNQRPAKMIKLSKRVDGTYYVVEAVPDTNAKSLAVVSAYIKKAPAQQTENVQAFSSNVRNDSADTGISDNIISQDDDTVNSSVRANAEKNTPVLTDKCELIATKHTATGDNIWVVSLKDRLSPDEYKDLREKVKAVGGYYSRFAKTPDGKAIPGFVFKTEPTAKELDVFNDFFGYTEETTPAENKSGIKEIDVNALLGAVENANRGDEIKLSDYEKQNSTERALNNQPESDMMEENTDKDGAENAESQSEVLDRKSEPDGGRLHAGSSKSAVEAGIEGAGDTSRDYSGKGLPESVGEDGSRPDVRNDRERVHGTDDTANAPSERAGNPAKVTDNAPENIETQVKTIEKKRPSNKGNFVITDDITAEFDNAPPSAKDNIEAIELLLAPENEGRAATAEEKKTLAKYKGWGGIDTRRIPYELSSRFSELFDWEQRKAMQSSQNNAFFTPTKVIDAMYAGLKRMGFKCGNVLETSMGVGNFFGRMPGTMSAKSALTGVELELYTARIAQYL